jgi:glucose-6-phosphate 1-epimerase
MTTTSTELDRRHGIPGIARVVDGQGGLPKVAVSTSTATGDLYLHGGQVTSWTPAGQRDVLFVSSASRWEPGRAIRGGIPVCFPWFGNKAGDPKAPAHGFVRSKAWTLEAIDLTDTGVVVTVATESDDHTKTQWPFDFTLLLRATFGASLHLELVMANTSMAPLTFEEALHTYYAIGDATTVRVAGLDGAHYLDKVDGGRERLQEKDITIAAEIDRVYVDTTSAIDIDDPTLGRRIRVDKADSRSTIVWNPWIEKARAMADLHDDDWTRLVCVETANVQPQAVVLGPGEQHAMSLTVSVSATR